MHILGTGSGSNYHSSKLGFGDFGRYEYGGWNISLENMEILIPTVYGCMVKVEFIKLMEMVIM